LNQILTLVLSTDALYNQVIVLMIYSFKMSEYVMTKTLFNKASGKLVEREKLYIYIYIYIYIYM